MFIQNNKKEIKQKFYIEQSITDGNVTFIVECAESLEGATNTSIAMKLYFAQQVGLKLRQVKILMKDGIVKTEAGALYYLLGDIVSETKMGGIGGFMKKAVSGVVTNESAAKPIYKGTGEILLEPSFKHYILLELKDEKIIVDKGMFFCCSGGIDVKPIMQSTVSSAFLGGEGLFQIALSGTGVVVLESNVPTSEIMEYQINPGEKLKVDGNFAIARTENAKFSVTKSDKNLIGSALNGEGFLNTFECTSKTPGTVWLAPTKPIYNKMNFFDFPFTNNNMNNQ